MTKDFTAEIDQRRRDIAARLPELKADALLVSSSANVRYLSGYTGSNGLILLLPSETHFFTDPDTKSAPARTSPATSTSSKDR